MLGIYFLKRFLKIVKYFKDIEINVGNKPTFVKEKQEFHIDITIGTSRIASDVGGSRVKKNLSEHACKIEENETERKKERNR